MRQRFTLGVLAAVALGTSGCRSLSPDLEPSDPAQHVPALDRSARVEEGGITLVAQAEEWPGNALITQEVTPLRVTLSNHGKEPVRVRYDDFTLQGSSGVRYLALPPYRVTGTVPTRAPGVDVLEPGFEHDRFAVAGPYAGAYPGVAVYDGRFDRNLSYYDTHYAEWNRQQQLPTPDMLAVALPEGVIEPGGYVSGWLYFQKVDDEEVAVRFRADLRAPDGGGQVARLTIPFTTD